MPRRPKQRALMPNTKGPQNQIKVKVDENINLENPFIPGQLRQHTEAHKRGVRSKPKGSQYSKGDYTGAPRAPHPPVFRKFGGNTRETVYPFEKQGTRLTGLLDNHYDPSVLAPPGQAAARGLLPAGATPIQGGAPAIVGKIAKLRPGSSNHWLYS